MPRTADKGLELVWKTGIDRPYEDMVKVPRGLMFEDISSAEWTFLYPRTEEQCNCKQIYSLHRLCLVSPPTFSKDPLVPTIDDPVYYILPKSGGGRRHLGVKLLALRKHQFFRVHGAITAMLGLCAL